MVERNYRCPKCGYNMLAISGGKVICLRSWCDWSVEAKRDEDNKLPDFSKLRRDWQ